MSNNIRGVTVKIGGDVTGLEKALKGVNSTIKSTQSQLREVEKQLKFDPKSTELLSQKQRLLNQAVDETREKLGTLKEAEKQVQEQFARGEVSQEQYDALQREIIKTESQLKSLEKQAAESNVTLSKIGAVTDEIAEKTGKLAEKTKGVSKAAAAVSSAVIGAGVKAVASYSDYEQLTGGIKKLFGDACESVLKDANDAYKTAGVSANDYMSSITAFSASLINSLGGDTEAAAKVANTAMKDIADNANTFGKYSAEELTSVYQALAKGQFNTLDNLNLGFGGSKEGMQQLIAKANELREEMGGVGDLSIDSFADMVEAIHLVQDNMNIAGTTAKEASGTIAGSIDETKSALENLATGIATPSADIQALTQNVIDAATDVKNNVLPVIQTIIDNLPVGAKIAGVILLVTAALSPVLGFISKANSAITAILPLISKVGAALKGVFAVLAANPVILIIAAIAAAVTALVVLIVKHWDTIKAWFSEMIAKVQEVVANIKQKIDDFKQRIVQKFEDIKTGISDKVEALRSNISNKFEAIKQKITAPIEAAKEKVRNAVAAIQSFFSGLKLLLPHIKLPHFSLTGKLSLSPPSVPHISVSWYKKAMDNAMLLNSPTIFGASGNTLLGAGEAGPEVVAGASKLMSMIRSAVGSEVNNSDTISLLKVIAANTGASTSVSINNREFGRLVKAVV